MKDLELGLQVRTWDLVMGKATRGKFRVTRAICALGWDLVRGHRNERWASYGGVGSVAC